MRVKGSIEMEKLVVWALAAVLALVMLYIMLTQLSVNNEESFIRSVMGHFIGFE